MKTNPNAMETMRSNCIFTNTALTDDGDVWWEGMTDTPPAHLTDWRGEDWTPDSKTPAAHPNARFTVPAQQNPACAPGVGGPQGRAHLGHPLRRPARRRRCRWSPSPSTGPTACSWGRSCRRRRPPPPPARSATCDATPSPCCRSAATTWPTTSPTGCASASPPTPRNLPRIYYVNWFRKDADGRFLWPGFGENSRVLAWIVRAHRGTRRGDRDPHRQRPRPGRARHRRARGVRRGHGRAAAGRRRRVARRGPAHPRALRAVSATASRWSWPSSSTPWSAASS